jgi:hypothetical protein
VQCTHQIILQQDDLFGLGRHLSDVTDSKVKQKYHFVTCTNKTNQHFFLSIFCPFFLSYECPREAKAHSDPVARLVCLIAPGRQHTLHFLPLTML